VALVEHLTTWPATVAVDRVHPARDELPELWGNGRAFVQSTIRHLVFGIVLGELERRFNGPDTRPVPPFEQVVSSNGHGDIEHAVGASES
jgi:hypothetical protein